MSTSELTWFKSSYSSSGSGDCVEVALSWHKFSHSGGSGDDCVEVATCPHTVHVRDSKAPEVRQLAVSLVSWGAFVSYSSGTAR
ncbi:DUF397 domain-containing protein [Streptomyces muensis]|uniref:DUF397 domain-containing protein n=1 Tax=Streptomyces muensis TaxID=1077944 RepID=A0A9X1TS79_STRM4|nr:DUF397 domain-containing protein [Streptomyces muensis]MCF1594253.1 DUF397 domain-containing protein [Streptomyces muensis]